MGAHRCVGGLRAVDDGQGGIWAGQQAAGDALAVPGLPRVHVLRRVHAPFNCLLRHAQPPALRSVTPHVHGAGAPFMQWRTNTSFPG